MQSWREINFALSELSDSLKMIHFNVDSLISLPDKLQRNKQSRTFDQYVKEKKRNKMRWSWMSGMSR